MSSLVLELQRDALDRATHITDLLRKAYAVASKLQVSDFGDWANNELNGYGSAPVPDYRVLKGPVKARDPDTGIWMAVALIDRDNELLHTSFRVNSSVAEIADLLRGDDEVSFMRLLAPEQAKKLTQGHGPMEAGVQVPRSGFVRILDRVRNAILDWSLRLEQENVLGEGMTFSTDEQARAHRNTVSLQNIFYTIGHMENSSIQTGSPEANQHHGG